MEPSIKQLSFEGKTSWRVYYEDTDFSGYVYHANYLKFFERAREEILGVEKLRELYQKGLHFVVAKIQISYHSPARHADLISVTTKMLINESPVVNCEQKAFLGDKCLVSAHIKLAAVNGEGKMTPISLESFSG